MSTFNEKCKRYFGTSDFYQVLNVSQDADERDLKKAYHKLSLIVHPDRVDENQKEVATEKFKVLGRIHSILQDKEKRKIYDECGDFEEEGDSSFNWTEYWFSVFKKIELKDIQRYEKEYIGSPTERRDIKRAYESSKGNMNFILEMVPFSSCDAEPRLIEIVREMVNNGEVEEYNAFFNETKVKTLRRHRKWAKEREEAEKIDMKELEKEMEANAKRRREELAAFVDNLEKKYASKKPRKTLTYESNNKPRKSTRKCYLKSKRRRRRKSNFKTKRFWSASDILAFGPFIASLFF